MFRLDHHQTRFLKFWKNGQLRTWMYTSCFVIGNDGLAQEISPDAIPNATKIFVNGAWVGIHRNPDKLVYTLRSLRRQVNISPEVSIVRDIDERELRLYTDAGRCCRPLFIVENEKLRITKRHIHDQLSWPTLISEGLVEIIDTEEEETTMIAMTVDEVKENRMASESAYQYTHCEIHPSMILGICGSIIPFPDHNQVCVTPLRTVPTGDSHLEILINLLWESKQWEFTSPTINCAWTLLHMCCTTHRNHL